MEEQFHGEVRGGNLWNSSRNLFCSPAINDFGWFNHAAIVDIKTAVPFISDYSAGTASDYGGAVVLQDVPNPNMSVASSLQMMGISLPSSTRSDDLNQEFPHEYGTSQENYSHVLQAVTGLNSSMNYRRKIPDAWDFSTNFFDQSFRSNSPSYLFDNDATIYSSPSDFPMNSTEVLPRLSNDTSMTNPSLQKQHTGNNTTFWHATAGSSFLPSTQPQLIPSSLSRPKLSPHNVTLKHHNIKAMETDSVRKIVGRNEPAFKRPRIETPSPLSSFKVRKEKLGDRVTALQQLVSPFGKTDTASVLHEAIEYIKLVHDQVAVLSTSYLQNGPPPLQRQQVGEIIKDKEGQMKDLKSRGLCLVPISSTFPVAAETMADFWTPTFGGGFR